MKTIITIKAGEKEIILNKEELRGVKAKLDALSDLMEPSTSWRNSQNPAPTDWSLYDDKGEYVDKAKVTISVQIEGI